MLAAGTRGLLVVARKVHCVAARGSLFPGCYGAGRAIKAGSEQGKEQRYRDQSN